MQNFRSPLKLISVTFAPRSAIYSAHAPANCFAPAHRSVPAHQTLWPDSLPIPNPMFQAANFHLMLAQLLSIILFLECYLMTRTDYRTVLFHMYCVMFILFDFYLCTCYTFVHQRITYLLKNGQIYIQRIGICVHQPLWTNFTILQISYHNSYIIGNWKWFESRALRSVSNIWAAYYLVRSSLHRFLARPTVAAHGFLAPGGMDNFGALPSPLLPCL